MDSAAAAAITQSISCSSILLQLASIFNIYLSRRTYIYPHGYTWVIHTVYAYGRRHCFIVSAAVHVSIYTVSGHCAVCMCASAVWCRRRRRRAFRFESPTRPSSPYGPRLDNKIYYILYTSYAHAI